MPPIEVYELSDTGQHVPVSLGDAPPPASARDGADSGVPGAPADPPATGEQDAGAPPAEPSSSSLGEDGGEGDDEPQEAVSLDDFNRHMARMRQRQRRAERARETERTQYQQELAGLRGQLDAMTRIMQGQAPDLGTPAQPAGPPQAEHYQSQDEYLTAKSRYEARQEIQQQAQQQQQTAQRQQLVERVEAFKQTHADFDAVMAAGFYGKVAPHVDQAVSLLPDGPGLAYALAQQPEVLARLNQLPPPLVFLELGRLALPQAATPAPPQATPTTTNGVAPTTPPTPLPPPMTPVSGQGSVPTGTFREDMTQEEYRQWRARTSQQQRWQQQRRT